MPNIRAQNPRQHGIRHWNSSRCGDSAVDLCYWVRSRSIFLSTVLIVIASYYGLFAVMSGSVRTLAIEAVPMAAFFGLAVAGFKPSGWLVAIGSFGHALFDFIHQDVIENVGVPLWWPGFCLAIDFTLGAFLSYYLLRSGESSQPIQHPNQ